MNTRRALRLIRIWMFPMVLWGCSPQAPTAASTPPASSPALDLQPCLLGSTLAKCGTLRVYEDRVKRSGRMIGLRVAVLKAASRNPAPDAIFYLAGGPGGAATEEGDQQISGSLRYDHDLVLVDQRGTGGSNRVVPPPSFDFTGPFQTPLERQMKAAVANPQIEKDMDPRFYTTSMAMDDLDDVREALGYDKIDLVGASYGATAAQYYLRQHEEHVRSVVLLVGSLLDVPVFERWGLNAQRALDRIFDECQADKDCDAAFPHIRQEFKDLWARMAEDPVTITFSDKSLGSATLTPQYLAPVLRLMTKDAKNDAAIPLLIHRAYADNDWQGFARFIETDGNVEWWGPQIMEHVIRCGEKWARFDPDEVARLSEGSYAKDFDVWLAQQQEAVCRLTPLGIMPEGTDQQPGSQVPMLIISADVDPIDPPENMAGAKELFPNSISLVMPYQSHNISDYRTGSCLWSIEDEFIQSGSALGLHTGCLQTLQPPVFLLNP
jgi:pimeloyl-ACP methyl ester carboxylesterase